MNRMWISGHQINRVQCGHPECLKLHALRSVAVRQNKWVTVTYIERLLSLCPDQPKVSTS